jgi:uncharacterized membrane protein YebE (DUF533 family)
MAAPTLPRMRRACAHAAEHYRREHMANDELNLRIQVTVDRVPHLAPEVGEDTDWYKVGSLFVEPLSRMLHVYLDSSSGAVKLEQPLEDVVSNDALGRRP